MNNYKQLYNLQQHSQEVVDRLDTVPQDIDLNRKLVIWVISSYQKIIYNILQENKALQEELLRDSYGDNDFLT